jgi:CHAD domain-containing protein
MAKANYELSADVSFQDAASRILVAAFRTMQANTAGTKAGTVRRDPTPEEVEALHDMRVGSRRLRAALSVFGSLFPREDLRLLDRQLGAITDVLGAVRDLDVHLETLDTLKERLPDNEAYGIGRLIARQIKKRNKERKRLSKELDHLEKERFERRFWKVMQRALPSLKDEPLIQKTVDSPDDTKETV